MVFLEIQSSAFHNYLNKLKSIAFNLVHKDGKYLVGPTDKGGHLLSNLLHFAEEEAYILAKTIDAIEIHTYSANRLKQKLVLFLNFDKAVELI